MGDRPHPDAAFDLLAALDRARLTVVACYWRRLRPTHHQWALCISLAEFGPALEPGLSRLLDAAEGVEGLRPLDLWALEPDASEPARYARAVAERGPAWPRIHPGDATLPPAVLYRLPSP